MRKILDFTIKYAYAGFMGVIVHEMAGFTVREWEWWVIMVPTIFLAEMKVELRRTK